MGALYRKWRLRWSLKFAVLPNLHSMMLNIESMWSPQCARLHDRPEIYSAAPKVYNAHLFRAPPWFMALVGRRMKRATARLYIVGKVSLLASFLSIITYL